MLTHADFVRIRVSLILNAVSGLFPTLGVKGRDNDPMQYVSWWSAEYHSGVYVVALGAVIGTVAVYALCQRSYWKWRAFALIGALVGMLPGFIYLWATRGHAEWLSLLIAMLIVGAIGGTILNTVLFFMLKPKQVTSVT